MEVYSTLYVIMYQQLIEEFGAKFLNKGEKALLLKFEEKYSKKELQ